MDMPDKQATSFMTIGNKKIPVSTEEIDIFQLDYYPENPRINYVLSKYGKDLGQDLIEKSLWALDSTKDLAEDIRINGGLLEEILVLNGQAVEGNTRLCAYRHLYKNAPEGQKNKWRKIRAKRLLQEIDVRDLFLLLGKLHIEGKTQWDPYEKASYIYKMSDENGMSLQEISQIVGMNVSSLRTQIAAYELMRDRYLPNISKIDDKEAEIKKFSIFYEYCRSADLQKIKKESPDLLTDEKFIKWVLAGRVRSAAYDVRKDLADILRCKPARKVFLDESPEEAIPAAKEVVARDRPETADSFFSKLDQMTRFLENARVIEIKGKVAENSRMRNMVEKFNSEAKKFYRNVSTPDEESSLGAITPINKKNSKKFN